MKRIVKRITEEWIDPDPGDEDQEALDASAEDDEQDDAKEEVRPSRRRGRR